MPMRDRGSASLPTRRTPTQPGHFGRNGGLINEHQVLGIKIRLGIEPGLTLGGDIGSLLLAGVRRFF